jgi:RNA polymerase sigma-70 factor (ECF subfamily)
VVNAVESELVERARRGDREAFELLIAGASPHLYRIARVILRDPSLAEEATQEALERAWRDLPALRDVRTFEAWMYRLLTHACADEGRRLRRWGASTITLSAEPSEPDPTSHVADRDQLERGLRQLTHEQRTILLLSFYLGMSSVEAAEVLDIPPGTAKSRLHYAIDALRAAIAAEDRADRCDETLEGKSP